MAPIPVPHVSWPIPSCAASPSDIVYSGNRQSARSHGNRRCRSWSSPILEVVLVTSSPNKKGLSPHILVVLHIRRPSTLLAAPPTLCPVPNPASLSRPPRVSRRARGLDLLAVPVLHYDVWRRRPTAHVFSTANSLSSYESMPQSCNCFRLYT